MPSLVVIEDEPLVALMIEEMAQDLGWSVEGSAHTEKDAFTLLQACASDLALLDIHPGLDTSLAVAQLCRDHHSGNIHYRLYGQRHSQSVRDRSHPSQALYARRYGHCVSPQRGADRIWSFIMTQDMSEGMVVCPACRTQNRLIVDNLPSNAEIHCSSCGGRIGVWSEADITPGAPNED